MVAIRAKTLMDRVNLFIKIADKDGNRALSYDEVHNLTRICLSKYIKVNQYYRIIIGWLLIIRFIMWLFYKVNLWNIRSR